MCKIIKNLITIAFPDYIFLLRVIRASEELNNVYNVLITAVCKWEEVKRKAVKSERTEMSALELR